MIEIEQIKSVVQESFDVLSQFITKIKIDIKKNKINVFYSEKREQLQFNGMKNEVESIIKEQFGSEWLLFVNHKNNSNKNSLSKLDPILVGDLLGNHQLKIKKMKPKKLQGKYGKKFVNKNTWVEWNETSRVFLSEYSEVHDVIPFHPEKKFRGTIIPFNLFTGWQGNIWCPEVNSLIYMRQDSTHKSGSIVKDAKVDFFIGVGIDNRGDFQFVARDWESGANRGDAPESAITVNYNLIQESKESIVEILQDSDQFILITSYQGDQDRSTSEKITEELNKLFPDYPTQILDWPKELDFKSLEWTGRYTHPILARYLSGAVVLFPPDVGGEEE